MVKVVIEKQERSELYMKLTDDMKEDSLTENDWANLKDLIELLEPFETISTLVQGHDSANQSMAFTLPGFDLLLEMLEKKVQQRTKQRDTGFQEAHYKEPG